MSEPTAAAMRAAHSVIGRDAFHYFKVLATGVDAAKAIDNATGLPELIAALDEVRHAYIHEISPQAWLGVMRNVDAALRIASEGRS